MYLNHLKTILRQPLHEKIVFHETSLWCQKRLGTADLESLLT